MLAQLLLGSFFRIHVFLVSLRIAGILPWNQNAAILSNLRHSPIRAARKGNVVVVFALVKLVSPLWIARWARMSMPLTQVSYLMD